MKPWNVRLAVLIGVTLVVVLAALALAGPMRFIRMPEGIWLWVRTPGAIKGPGGQYRFFIWGPDAVVRVELDTDGDGRYDLRGDDWQRVAPRWCWSRGPSGWEPAPPEHCVAARDRLVKIPE
ncbi:hypothetical protein ACLESO_53540 [Pyxidicoccus sp. 3LG]